MAYNKGFNPDRLPAHAEPEQAAQYLSQSSTSRPLRTSSARPDYNKPAPPQSSASRQDYRTSDDYRPQPLSSASSRQDYARPHALSSASGRQDYRTQDDYSKPLPHNPNSSRQDYRANDAYRTSGGYDSRPDTRPGAYNDPRYDSQGRQATPRYDQQRPDPRHDGYAYGAQGLGSPPPQNYGHGPPPAEYHGRPIVADRPPATPAPPRDASDRDALWGLFGVVDKNRNGTLSEVELQTALVNGDWTAFDPHTVRMMIRMFDTDRSGDINFEEFCGLWGFLAAWRKLFDDFKNKREMQAGEDPTKIYFGEFSDALVKFGYRLSQPFVQLLFRTYDRSGIGALSFDLFVQACISLKRMTDVFKRYDEDRDGYITLSFEEFLTGAQALFLFNSISATTDTGLY